MTDRKLRIGVIGAGMIALMSHIPNLRATGKAEVVAICRRDARRLAQVQEKLGIAEAYTDWREMLDRVQLDGVVVSTPHHLHAAPTLAALERGLHVLVEKPMALTSRDAQMMVEAAQQAQRVLIVTYSPRYAGLWRTVKQKLDEGVIGSIRQLNLAFCIYRRWIWEAETAPAEGRAYVEKMSGMPEEFFVDWNEWHRDPARMGGGMFADNGPHVVDLALWLAGAPPVEVMAFGEAAGLPVECFLNIQARLANGVLLSLTSADTHLPSTLGGQERWMIVGDRGALTADAAGDVWVYGQDGVQKIEATLPSTSRQAAFVAAIDAEELDLTPASEGVWTVALMEAAYRSAAEGRVVAVQLVAKEVI